MYKSGSHSKYRLMYHIVWIPKYRKRILKGVIKARIDELLRQCADMNRWQIEELNIQPDHVHLLIQFRPSLSVSDSVQRLKGGTSKVIRQEYPELEEFLWGPNFWAEGYFAEIVGKVNEDVIRKYIQSQ